MIFFPNTVRYPAGITPCTRTYSVLVPVKYEQVVFCKLSDFQLSLYKLFISSPEIQALLRGVDSQPLKAINILKKLCNHPELLDFLATEFVRTGWKLKPLHRLMVNSATYRQSSAYRKIAHDADADNQWLWRFPMQRLDAGTHQQNAAALQELLDAIGAEFPDLGIDQRPLGTVSKCFLGGPYEVHRCDLDGNIVEHFERHRAMPPYFERARSLAAHGAYRFIEIYADSLRAIAADGSVAVL